MHIVSSELGENLVRGAAKVLTADGLLALYGPFKYGEILPPPSNANFDEWLKDRNAQSGIRDFEWVDDLAKRSPSLRLMADQRMPANNQMLIFKASANE